MKRGRKRILSEIDSLVQEMNEAIDNNDFNKDDSRFIIQRLQDIYQSINSPIFEWPKSKLIISD